MRPTLGTVIVWSAAIIGAAMITAYSNHNLDLYARAHSRYPTYLHLMEAARKAAGPEREDPREEMERLLALATNTPPMPESIRMAANVGLYQDRCQRSLFGILGISLMAFILKRRVLALLALVWFALALMNVPTY